MSAYLVANYRITNPEGYRPYPPAVAPTLVPFGGELLVADFESTAVEGESHAVTIIVKFSDKETAQRWYNSDAYQAVLGLRANNTEGFLVFVDGVEIT